LAGEIAGFEPGTAGLQCGVTTNETPLLPNKNEYLSKFEVKFKTVLSYELEVQFMTKPEIEYGQNSIFPGKEGVYLADFSVH
jgi:hypothetical protein